MYQPFALGAPSCGPFVADLIGCFFADAQLDEAFAEVLSAGFGLARFPGDEGCDCRVCEGRWGAFGLWRRRDGVEVGWGGFVDVCGRGDVGEDFAGDGKGAFYLAVFDSVWLEGDGDVDEFGGLRGNDGEGGAGGG